MADDNKIPNEAFKRFVENPPLVIHKEADTHRIGCPYCQLGFVLVRVEQHRCGGQVEVQVPEMHKPHKCELCGKWVKLKTQMRITAVRTNEENQ